MDKYRFAVVDCRMERAMMDKLTEYADVVLPLPPFDTLQVPVSAHPDMLLWRLGDNIVTYRSYRQIAHHIFEQLESAGYKILCEDDPTEQSYPHDVALNCATVGKHLIANRRTVSGTVTELCERNGVTLLHTNQGYAKCSTLTLTDNAVITADRGIYSLCLKNGIDALLITEGNVRLDGYDHGFIGGATGVTDKYVLFTGNVHQHPDSKAINDFCKKHQKSPINLSNAPLYDYGTILFF